LVYSGLAMLVRIRLSMLWIRAWVSASRRFSRLLTWSGWSGGKAYGRWRPPASLLLLRRLSRSSLCCWTGRAVERRGPELWCCLRDADTLKTSSKLGPSL